jgi:surface protein
MTSLTQLNESAASPIEVTDARPATVIFDRFAPRDFLFTISNLNKVLTPQVGINEIVNYSTANVRYRITIRTNRAAFISGSSITFNGMPSGASVATTTTTFAKVYTVSGLTSAKGFDQIKTVTWNLPVDFALTNKFWVESEVVYYDQATDKEVINNWASYDPFYYFLAALETSSSFAAVGGYTKKATGAFIGQFDLETSAPYTNFRMASTARVYVTALGRKARLLQANLSTPAATFTASSIKTARPTVAFTSTSTVVCRAGEIVRLINRADFFAIAGRIGPAGVPYLEGNGLPYYNYDGTLLNIGGLPPGIFRIRSVSAALTVTGGELVVGDKIKRVTANLTSNFTVPSIELEYYKGVGLFNTASVSTVNAGANITASGRAEVVSAITVYAKGAGPERAAAAITATATQSAQAVRNRLANSAMTAASSLSAIGQLYAPMLITVNVPASAPSTQRLVMFNFTGATAVNIEWGDGTSNNVIGTFTSGNANTGQLQGHTYPASSTSTDYQIKINGLNYPSASITGITTVIYSGSYESKYRIKSVDSWGDTGVSDLSFAFLACQNLQSVPNNCPSTVTNMNNLFSNIVSNQINTRLANIASWNTANVTNMGQMFLFDTYFNINISSWNTANVTNMQGMFANTAFDQNISGWSVPLIPSKPASFDTGTPATWITAEKPNWGV